MKSFLPPPPEFWDCMHVLLCPVLFSDGDETRDLYKLGTSYTM